jgi:hypothetical protein
VFTARYALSPYIKQIRFVFKGLITGLHNKPQGCGASVASAAGPFTTKKKKCFDI